jgi:ankyrin repeat protein
MTSGRSSAPWEACEVGVSHLDALFESIRTGDYPAVAKALDEDPELVNARSERGVSAALMACYTGQAKIRDLLIDKGARLELHEAVAAGKLAKVKEFADAKPELARSYSPDGFPMIALAAAFGHEDVARYLHEKGAEMNALATNGTGYNALTGAVAGRHSSIAKWLVENGADVNYRYAQGHSPFLEAAANGNLEIVKLLVAHGADVHSRTDAGKSALNFAQEKGHQGLVEYLQSLGLTS